MFEELPEVGDPDKPQLVFFFDEAHLLFDDAPKALIDKVEQVARLIRSKGVGIYFITQNPADVPEDILGQLGNRIQHALRAFTARDRKNLRMAADFVKLGIDPMLFKRLHAVLEMELGHDIAFAVEGGKIQLNQPDVAAAGIDLRVIEPALWAGLAQTMMDEILANHSRQIADCARETLAMAEVAPDRIGKIVFVGGSSLLKVVEDVMIAMFPNAGLERAEAFTAVADGLAIAASRDLPL